jgi:hypothetical protein
MSDSFRECPAGGDGLVEPADGDDRVAGGWPADRESYGARAMVSAGFSAVPEEPGDAGGTEQRDEVGEMVGVVPLRSSTVSATWVPKATTIGARSDQSVRA